MWTAPEIRVIELSHPNEFEEVRSFLDQFGLRFDHGVEYTIALFIDEQIVGTGSFAGNVLRNIAVLERYQGEGLTAVIVSRLMEELAKRGCFHYFLFTKPGSSSLFESLGFTVVGRAEPYAVLLETGIRSIDSFCKQIREKTNHLPPGKRAAIVVNCNPFTLGHRAIVQRAAEENDAVIVFVVSEDRSLFPFEARFRLVQEGVADLSNVAVVSAGPYIISQATFPDYFTRQENVAMAQTQLDAAIFGSGIAPETGITVRYVGEEPACPVTEQYNQTLSRVLPSYGIELRIIQRVTVNGDFISASKVRDMIRQDNWTAIARVVPTSTYEYLVSDAAEPVIARIKSVHSRH